MPIAVEVWPVLSLASGPDVDAELRTTALRAAADQLVTLADELRKSLASPPSRTFGDVLNEQAAIVRQYIDQFDAAVGRARLGGLSITSTDPPYGRGQHVLWCRHVGALPVERHSPESLLRLRPAAEGLLRTTRIAFTLACDHDTHFKVCRDAFHIQVLQTRRHIEANSPKSATSLLGTQPITELVGDSRQYGSGFRIRNYTSARALSTSGCCRNGVLVSTSGATTTVEFPAARMAFRGVRFD